MATKDRGSWFRRVFSRSKSIPLDPTRTDLVVVASCFDDAESCTAAFDRASASEPVLMVDEEVVLRHHLVLPPEAVSDAQSVAAQDGYAPAVDGPGAAPTGDHPEIPGGVAVVLQRVQVLDALHCSQERSRMAGLAQRRGGTVLGWDALQPARSAEPGSD